MSLSKVFKGSFWLYLRIVTINLAGFLYWMVISAIGGSEIVGLTSATVALAWTTSSLLSLGVDIGVRRFLGMYAAKNNRREVASYFWSTLLFYMVLHASIGLTITGLGLLGVSISNFTPEMLIYAGIIVMLNFTVVFDSLLISFLKTKVLFIAALAGNLVKLSLGITLVMLGWGWIGAVIGYVVFMPVYALIAGRYSITITGLAAIFNLQALKETLKAGYVSWLPETITILGQYLGVLTLFGFKGASETGSYYVTFAIASVVYMAGFSILNIMFPVLSGMEDGRKRMGWRATKVSLAIATPMAFALIAYPEVLLSLLGKEYIEASPALQMLALSIPAALLTAGVNSLIYAYGMYTAVLSLGLAVNLPRIAAYAPFSSMFGGLGTALSYTSGAYIGLAAALMVARRVGLKINAKHLLLVTLAPLGLTALLYELSVPWFLGAPILLAASYMLYLKAKVLTKTELKEISYAFASKETVQRAYAKLRPILAYLIE